jgi:hypothetical protein|nr:MAG TPA: hypothetical protein [Caudoviricetes sp.]
MPTRDKPYDARVASTLAAHHDELRRRCRRHFRRGALQFEDIMQETMLFVMCDSRAALITGTAALLDYFVYKFRMIMFQTMKRNRKMMTYADNQKTTQTEPDD